MKSKNMMILGVIFSIAVLIVIGTIAYSIMNDKKEKGKDTFLYGTQQSLGKSDAPVQIVEFGDFKCPVCGVWDANVLPQLKKEYMDTGKVQFHFINFPFIGKDSELGAAAGEAIYKQDPKAFWTFSSELYKKQQDVKTEWITEDLLVALVKEHLPNIDVNQFQKDLNSKEIKDKVKKDFDLAMKLKVQGAPSIYVNGELVNRDLDSIKAAIDKAKKK